MRIKTTINGGNWTHAHKKKCYSHLSNTQKQNCRTHSGTNSFIPQFLPLKSAPNRRRSEQTPQVRYVILSHFRVNFWQQTQGNYWVLSTGKSGFSFWYPDFGFCETHKIKNRISKLRNPLLRWIIIIIIIIIIINIIISYPTSEIVNFLLLHSFKRWVPYFNPLKHLLF